MYVKKKTLLALAATAGVVLATAAPANADLTVGIGGAGERQVHQEGHRSMVDDMLDARGGDRVNVDYKSSVWPQGPYTHDESITDGTERGGRVIDDYRASHPGGKVTVIGHSLGAPVARNLAPKADKVILFGDPANSNGVYRALSGFVPGISSPGPEPLPPNTVSVCHQYDMVCDTRSPIEDPAYFAQSFAGYAFNGYHGYNVHESDGLAPGEYTMPMAPPIKEIPGSTPTGIPAPGVTPLPVWEPGPMPSVVDVTPKPYKPTPVSDYLPNEVKQALPPEILNFTPPPLF